MNENNQDQTGIIDYKNKKIVLLDLVGCQPDEIIPRAEKTKNLIRTSQPNSVLMITDFTKMRYNKITVDFAKQFTKDNKPFMKKSAFLGIDGLKKIIFQASMKFSGRDNMKIFNTKEEALEWLIQD